MLTCSVGLTHTPAIFQRVEGNTAYSLVSFSHIQFTFLSSVPLRVWAMWSLGLTSLRSLRSTLPIPRE
jgi:hypothetical protein